MSEFEDDPTDTGDGATGSKPAGKGLRDAVEAAQRRVAELETENATLKQAQRKTSVTSALEKHGARPSIARFYDGEGTSDDDVLKWLQDNGEDFGWQPGDPDEGEDQDVTDARRISRATTSAPQRTAGVQITPEFIRTAPREELIKLGVLRGQ